jgi:hypothetical protein
MRTRVAVGLSFVLFLIAGDAARARGQDALPAARAIVDRYVEVTGGRDLHAKHTSRRALGKVSMPAQGVEGDVEILAARPDLLRLRMTLPGVGEILSGYDGKVGWSVNPLTGPMLLEGKALEQTKADADFDSSLHSDTKFKLLETIERTTFEGRPAYKVRAVRQSGDEDFEFFDVENGLMIGAMVTRETPMGPVKATHVTTDYKDFGGLKVATKITQRLMGTEQVITISAVEFNTVDHNAFAPPPQIQALIK